MATPKSIAASKTFWVNLLMMAIAITDLFSTQPWLPPNASEYILLVSGIANVVLRWLTDQPVALVTRQIKKG